MTRALTLAWLLLCAACAAESRTPHSAPSEAGRYVRALEEAHQLADRAADADQARRTLETVREREVPGELSSTDRRTLLQDLQFRLAALALSAKDPARALSEAERGLSYGAVSDVFTANLQIAKGRAHADLGQRSEAARSYSQALQIHERLLDRALQPGP